jgi:hypothetical protein
MRVSENGEDFSLERVVLANNLDLGGKVAEVGSVWRFPSIESTTIF